MRNLRSIVAIYQKGSFDDDSPANVLNQGRRRFGRLCAALAEQGYANPHLLSLFDFHQAVEYLTQKHEAA